MGRRYANIHIGIQPADFARKPRGSPSPIFFGRMRFSLVSIILSGENAGTVVRLQFTGNLTQPVFSVSSRISIKDPFQDCAAFCTPRYSLYLASPLPPITLFLPFLSQPRILRGVNVSSPRFLTSCLSYLQVLLILETSEGHGVASEFRLP